MKKTTKDKKRAGGQVPAIAILPTPAVFIAAASNAARPMTIASLVWMGLILLSSALIGCSRFSLLYAIGLLLSLGIVACEFWLLRKVIVLGRGESFGSLKKFTGYALVLHYAAAALPRVEWTNAGLIDGGRLVFLYMLSVLCLAAGIVLFFLMSRPRLHAALGLITEAEAKDSKLRKKRPHPKKAALGVALEWVDALGFAAIAVILVNIFVFQLYVVPSESMVPTFLDGDRPFTVKFMAGPRLPLTEWRLPFARLPQRGDVVTIANPRYLENQRVDLKKYLGQLVAMVTFTAIDLNRYREDGSPKYDPLVKRVVGLPGEKLMMVDDILYHRRAGESSFTPVAEDAAWSKVDLWKDSIAANAKKPIDKDGRELRSQIDEKKNGTEPAELATRIQELGSRVKRSLSLSGTALADFEKREFPMAEAGFIASRDRILGDAKVVANIFSELWAYNYDLEFLFALGRSPALQGQLTAWIGGIGIAATNAPANQYERGSRALNGLLKLNLLSRMYRDLELVGAGASYAAIKADPESRTLAKEAGNLAIYVQGSGLNGFGGYDARNFPEFPGGGEYLGPEQYFAMGDNRYNSVDFRFYNEGNFAPRRLDPADPASMIYQSNLSPFALDLKFIEGFAMFRVWPPNRVGSTK